MLEWSRASLWHRPIWEFQNLPSRIMQKAEARPEHPPSRILRPIQRHGIRGTSTEVRKGIWAVRSEHPDFNDYDITNQKMVVDQKEIKQDLPYLAHFVSRWN